MQSTVPKNGRIAARKVVRETEFEFSEVRDSLSPS